MSQRRRSRATFLLLGSMLAAGCGSASDTAPDAGTERDGAVSPSDVFVVSADSAATGADAALAVVDSSPADAPLDGPPSVSADAGTQAGCRVTFAKVTSNGFCPETPLVRCGVTHFKQNGREGIRFCAGDDCAGPSGRGLDLSRSFCVDLFQLSAAPETTFKIADGYDPSAARGVLVKHSEATVGQFSYWLADRGTVTLTSASPDHHAIQLNDVHMVPLPNSAGAMGTFEASGIISGPLR